MISTIIFLIIASSFLYSFFTKNRTAEGCGKEVSRKSWQYRLIAWTIKSEPDFKGYCPYFWCMWLCIFLLPFTLICKVLEFIGSLWKGYREEAISETEIHVPSMEYIANFIKKGLPETKLAEWYPEWYAVNPNWRAKFDAWAAAQEKKEERARKRREFVTNQLEIAAKWTHWMVKPLIISSALLIAYAFWYILAGISSVVSAGDFFNAMGVLLIILAAISLCKYIVRWVKTAAVVTKQVTENVNIPISTTDDGPGFMSKVWDVVTFPFRLAARTYSKECPIIKFKD